MRILRVAGDLYPDIVGGIGLHVHEMSRWQAKYGHRVMVCTFNRSKKITQEFRNGYEVKQFGIVLELIGNPINPTFFKELFCIRNDFDIIHAHSHLFFSTNICALVSRLGSSPLVITNHGFLSQTAPMWLQSFYIPTIAKWTLNSADAIICYTEHEKSILEELGIQSDKISVIHNGIDIEVFVPYDKERDKNLILWIGRFTPGKGVEYLIDGFNILVKERPDLKLLMIGDGPSKEYIKQKILKLGLDEKIIMKEFVPNQEILPIYQNSSVFVLPSIDEGVPRTILEAMACGIPVVCTELPQLVDIVKGCGITVPKRDPIAIYEAISKILSDKDLFRKLSENGRKNVVDNYSWEDTVTRTISLYEELICQK